MFTIPFIIGISFFFIQATHPLSIGLLLLIQTVLIAISGGLLSHSFWISYIIFLIFLGAILVLFIYVASLAANEQFNFNIRQTSITVFLTLLLLITIFFLDPILRAETVKSETSSHWLSYLQNPLPSTTSSLYEIPSSQFTLFIISYLLLALIIIVKIINVKSKPLRPY